MATCTFAKRKPLFLSNDGDHPRPMSPARAVRPATAVYAAFPDLDAAELRQEPRESTPVFPPLGTPACGRRAHPELSQLLLWKRRGPLYPFSLEQVTALVPPQDFQACSDREAHQRNEGIRKTNAIDVVATRTADQIACDVVAPEKQVENGRVDVLGRCEFPWRSSPPATGRRLDISADEPSADPSGSDLLHWRWRPIVQRSRDRRHIDFVGNVEMLEALANAPEVLCRLPVQPRWTQPTREIVGHSIGGLQFLDQADRPGRQSGVTSHSSSLV
jgi:hypothetical protein